MKSFLKTFLNDESGASAAEYALILAVVGVAIGAGALVLGQNVGESINNSAKNVGKSTTKAAAAPVQDGTADADGVDGTECN